MNVKDCETLYSFHHHCMRSLRVYFFHRNKGFLGLIYKMRFNCVLASQTRVSNLRLHFSKLTCNCWLDSEAQFSSMLVCLYYCAIVHPCFETSESQHFEYACFFLFTHSLPSGPLLPSERYVEVRSTRCSDLFTQYSFSLVACCRNTNLGNEYWSRNVCLFSFWIQ